MNSVRILLADDHNLFRNGLRRILEAQEGFKSSVKQRQGWKRSTWPSNFGPTLRSSILR